VDGPGNLPSSGLDVPWRRHMVERFAQVGGELLAVLSNGSLLSTSFGSFIWKELFPEVIGVAAVTDMHVADMDVAGMPE